MIRTQSQVHQKTPKGNKYNANETKTHDTIHTRLRKALRPAACASPAGVGALFPAVAVAVVVFLVVDEGTWFRAVAVFLAAAVVEVEDVFMALRAPVPVLVGLMIVVPDDALEELLFLRSRWRVAGRGSGERMPLVPGRTVCDVSLPSFVVFAPFAPEKLAVVALSGLDRFRGDMGFER